MCNTYLVGVRSQTSFSSGTTKATSKLSMRQRKCNFNLNEKITHFLTSQMIAKLQILTSFSLSTQAAVCWRTIVSTSWRISYSTSWTVSVLGTFLCIFDFFFASNFQSVESQSRFGIIRFADKVSGEYLNMFGQNKSDVIETIERMQLLHGRTNPTGAFAMAKEFLQKNDQGG